MLVSRDSPGSYARYPGIISPATALTSGPALADSVMGVQPLASTASPPGRAELVRAHIDATLQNAGFAIEVRLALVQHGAWIAGVDCG